MCREHAGAKLLRQLTILKKQEVLTGLMGFGEGTQVPTKSVDFVSITTLIYILAYGLCVCFRGCSVCEQATSEPLVRWYG